MAAAAIDGGLNFCVLAVRFEGEVSSATRWPRNRAGSRSGRAQGLPVTGRVAPSGLDGPVNRHSFEA
jgi:hypothetical protein